MAPPTVFDMGGQTVRWTAEQVLALAPDDASRRAGSKLSGPGPWTESGSGEGAVWGLCKGSGSKPYQTVVDLDGGNGPGYRCSCPSRKFPCKHAMGLLLLWAAGDESAVAEASEPPEWASTWMEGRRQRADRGVNGKDGAAGRATEAGSASGTRAEAESGTRTGTGSRADQGEYADEDGTGTGGSGAGTQPGATRIPDTRAEAARRRAEQRAARMAGGAEELEQRLEDLLRGGLAGADQAGYAPWEEMAARMVDAQVPGLASRVRELGTVPGSGDGWPERLLAECALLHMLARGYLRIDALPGPLAETVKARVGLTVETAELLSGDAGHAARVRDEWLVLAQRDTDEGRLTARRIWLYGRTTGRIALLLSYGAAGRPPELALPVGTTLDADLAYYPGGRRLRAVLGERHGVPRPGFLPPGGDVPDALAAYGEALCDDPWLDGWPYVLRDVLPVPPSADAGGRTAGAREGWQLASEAAEFALPIVPGTPAGALWKLAAISAEGPVTVFGECGHRGFAPYAAWSGGATVPL